jgi:hypothetical protein
VLINPVVLTNGRLVFGDRLVRGQAAPGNAAAGMAGPCPANSVPPPGAAKKCR